MSNLCFLNLFYSSVLFEEEMPSTDKTYVYFYNNCQFISALAYDELDEKIPLYESMKLAPKVTF